MEASQDKTDVIIRLLFGGFVIHFAGIFHLSCSVQKFFQDFHARAMIENLFSIFRGKSPNGATLNRSASSDTFWSRWLMPFGL
jgi:hypothetical protein